MARRGSDPFAFLTFGGRVPSIVGGLLAALVVLSVANALTHGEVAATVALSPGRVLGGEVWRLVTWSLLETSPINLIFAALWIWQTGTQQAWTWGPRRFAGVWFGLTAGAGLAQTAAALVWPAASVAQASPWAVLVALLLMWALQNPGNQLSWFGVLPMTTEMLAWVLVGGTVLFAIFSGPGAFVTNFAALGLAYVIAGPGLPFRRWWYRLRADLHVRSARRRARSGKLKVVSKNGSDDRPRWIN
jgi:membrane associated rhomboid family serine protease